VILKGVGRQYLRNDVVNRRKSGFGVTLGKWLMESRGLGTYADDLREDNWLHQYIRKEKLERIVKQDREGKNDFSEFLSAPINFMLWARTLQPSYRP